MPSKILNIFELLVLLLIANHIRNHYFFSPIPSYIDYFLFKLLSDIILGIAIAIRLKDLVFNFNQRTNSYKKFQLPLLLYSIGVSFFVWETIRLIPYYNNIFTFVSFFEAILPVIILSGRIIFIKRNLEALEDSEDVLDC